MKQLAVTTEQLIHRLQVQCIFLSILLSGLLFIVSACDMPSFGVNNNGNNNGQGNNSNNKTVDCYGANNTCIVFEVNNVTIRIAVPVPFPARLCQQVTTHTGTSTIIMGSTRIQGTAHAGDARTGILAVIGSNKSVPVCGIDNYSMQSNIDNSAVEETVSDDILYMKNVKGCGSKCSTVKRINV